MSLIRGTLSRILNLLLEPLVCRIADRLLPQLLPQVRELKLALIPPFLPIVIKNELQNIAHLPLSLLTNLQDLGIVGYYAKDVAALLPNSRSLPITGWIGSHQCHDNVPLPSNLLILDEYYFLRGMDQLFCPLSAVSECLIFATRFEYFSDWRFRTQLHQLGFMEVVLVSYDELAGHILTFAASHAGPVTSHPIFLDNDRPPEGPLSSSIWLVARKVPKLGAPAYFSGFTRA